MVETEVKIPEPSTLSTRLLVLEADGKFEDLSKMLSYDEMAAASYNMKHGDVRAMHNWAAVQEGGSTAPWQFKRLGPIPLPWAALVIFFVLWFGRNYLPLGLLLTLSIIGVFVFAIVAVNMIEYVYSKAGRCLICGEGAGDNWKKSVEVYDSKGQKLHIARSGYCDRHAVAVFRRVNWKTVETQIWNMIRDNPVHGKPGLFKRLAYAFLWIPPFRMYELFADPRPVGMGNFYIKPDRVKPRDTIAEDEVESCQMMLFLVAQKLENIKFNMRRRR